MAIFPAVFAFGLDAGSGITLMFETIPQVFAQMGTVGMLFSFMFFFLVFIAAITSMVSIMETGTSYFADKFKINKTKIAIVVGAILIGIASLVSLSIGSALAGDAVFTIFGNDLLTLFDDLTNKIIMPVVAMCTCIFVNVTIRPKSVVREMRKNGHAFKFGEIWIFCIKYVSPILIFIVLVAGISSIVASAYGLFVVCLATVIIAITIVINQIMVVLDIKRSALGLVKENVVKK